MSTTTRTQQPPLIKFQLDVHLHLHQANETALMEAVQALAVKVGRVADSQAVTTQQGARMETAIEKITREVAEMKAMAAAAAAKMTEAADTIRNNIGNSDALNQLADELEGAQVELQGGIDKLTPPAPPPPPAEPDPEAA